MNSSTAALPLALLAAFCASLALTPSLASTEPSGPLDLPAPTRTVGTGEVNEVEDLEPAPGVTDQASLERAVEREQRSLERLRRPQLERRAEEGERGAQVALGTDFAEEAESLTFAPAAANDALSDAVRWYSQAASSGFPGAPSLDQAGISFHPIRVQRSRP